MKVFRDPLQPRDQVVLFTTTVGDYLPQDAPVRVFHELVAALDHTAWLAAYAGGGAPAYHPVMLAEVLLFAYNQGVRSSRQIADLCVHDVRFVFLAEGQRPDFRTLCAFRRQHADALAACFRATVHLAMELGLVTLEHVAVDGTKIEANAARDQAYTADRLTKALAQAEGRLQAALAEAEALDAEAEAQPEPTLPPELATAAQRLARLRAIQQARAAAGASGPYVATDPASGVIKTRAGKRPAYNVEIAVDAQAQCVLAVDVTATAADNHAAPAVLDQVIATTGAVPDVASMDGGFWSPETLQYATEQGIDLYLPPQGADHAADGFVYDDTTDTYTCPTGDQLDFRRAREKDGRHYRIYRCRCGTCPQAATCHGRGKRVKEIWRRILTPVEQAHHAKMATPAAQTTYRIRARTVEPVFGQWKTVSGFTRCVVRGLAGATIEALLVACAHNLRKCAAVWRTLAGMGRQPAV